MNLTPDDLRIRQALEQIETPMYDIAGAVREQRARRGRRMRLRSPRHALVTAVVAVLLTATAAAAMVQLSGGWDALFGQGTVLPDGLTTPVWQTQTVDGCTITLEDAIVSEDDVAVLYSFRYEDGSSVNGDTHITLLGNSELLMDGSADYCLSASGLGSGDSQDPTVEYYYEAFTLSEDPGDRRLTLQVGPASRIESTDALPVPVDLAAIYHAQPVSHAVEANGAQRLAALQQQDCTAVLLPQSDQSPDIRFAGVSFEGEALCLSLVMPAYDSYDGEAAQIESVRDTRTGQLHFGALHTYGDTGGDLQLCQTQFEGLTADDLPYLEPQVSYRRSTPLTDQGWSFDFSAPSARTLTRALGLLLADDVRVENMMVSPLGLEITGTMPVSSEEEHPLFSDQHTPVITLVLRDGSTVGTDARSHARSTGGPGAQSEEFSIEYQYLSESGSRRFLQTETVAAIRIGHVTIPIEE